MSEEGQPRWPAITGNRPIRDGKDTSLDIFINIGAERLVDLLGDTWTAEAWVASYWFDDGLNEFVRRALRVRFTFAAGRIQQSVLQLLEQAVKFQQRRWPDNDSSPLEVVWAEKQ